MGFNANDLRFFLSARGFVPRGVCTLGRQNLFATAPKLNSILTAFGKPRIELPRRAILFLDDLLAHLGMTIDSIDASDFEGATIIHDMNRPLPPEFDERYDAVWDGGTLEHIFNFPTALHNAMRSVKVGGHYFARTPTNNQCGHGFYQFSAELFYRIFSKENQFALRRIYITDGRNFYHVVDPAMVGSRVELLGDGPAFLMIDAEKIGVSPPEISISQQSDYSAQWSSGTVKADGKLKAIGRRLLSQEQIEQISTILNRLRQRRAVRRWKANSRLSNFQFYRRVGDWTTLTSEAFSITS